MALDDFISKVIITKEQEIDIPNDAKSCTPKKDCVYFYRNGDGKYSIEGAKKISFPGFVKHQFHTYYGEPVFT